jgi:hypothetical protein
MANSAFNFQDFLKKMEDRLRKEMTKRQRKTAPDPTSRGFDTETEEDTGFTPRSNASSNLIKFIRFCLFFAAGALIVANIKPYVNIVSWLGNGLGAMPIAKSLSTFPPFGWLLDNGGMGLALIAGFLLWGLLQGLEMLPKIILNDPEALLVLMSWVHQFKKITHRESDSPLLTKLKYRFNNLPLEWIEGMQQARAIAYIVDGILCFTFYPPIVGGYDRLGVFLVAPSIKDLDVYNIVASIATMFGLEVLYEVYKLIKTALDIMAETQAHQSI